MAEFAVSLIEHAGFEVLGSFCPNKTDKVPPISKGISTGGVLIIGNAGPVMFDKFSRERDTRRELLDDWCQTILDPIAELVEARAVYPWQRPFLPFLTWAQKAGAGKPSPLGMNIHPEFGLWHGFRGAFLFANAFNLPEGRSQVGHPCDTCQTKPCLSTCPVDAFASGHNIALDVEKCIEFLNPKNGETCLKRGCRARLACPVGARFAYSTEQISFHLSAFYRSCTKVN